MSATTPGAGADRAARLRALRRTYLAEAAADCAELARLVAAPCPTDEGWRRARKLAHDLRGSGGSYGFPEVSAAAAALEGALAAPAPDAARLPALVKVLEEALARAARSLP